MDSLETRRSKTIRLVMVAVLLLFLSSTIWRSRDTVILLHKGEMILRAIEGILKNYNLKKKIKIK